MSCRCGALCHKISTKRGRSVHRSVDKWWKTLGTHSRGRGLRWPLVGFRSGPEYPARTSGMTAVQAAPTAPATTTASRPSRRVQPAGAADLYAGSVNLAALVCSGKLVGTAGAEPTRGAGETKPIPYAGFLLPVLGRKVRCAVVDCGSLAGPGSLGFLGFVPAYFRVAKGAKGAPRPTVRALPHQRPHYVKTASAVTCGGCKNPTCQVSASPVR